MPHVFLLSPSPANPSPYQPGACPYPHAGHLLITMPILGIPSFFEGESLSLSSPLGVSILGIGISSRLVTPPSSTRSVADVTG
eukprot:9486296-Pyramimonas_sp.AAC.1